MFTSNKSIALLLAVAAVFTGSAAKDEAAKFGGLLGMGGMGGGMGGMGGRLPGMGGMGGIGGGKPSVIGDMGGMGGMGSAKTPGMGGGSLFNFLAQVAALEAAVILVQAAASRHLERAVEWAVQAVCTPAQEVQDLATRCPLVTPAGQG
ncbi:unnamed protein product [Hyaloperonospora brassicae]|uniref:RxLR effector candidate protein n=1 Tax=Hyaloperonospora brassicae TaxID=162125 RepID=A0AAV0UT96_HYABA|nr:unnamed protein product [Hyaloperonospora brassicae]